MGLGAVWEQLDKHATGKLIVWVIVRKRLLRSCSTAFLYGKSRRLLCTFNTSWRLSSKKRL